MEQRVHASPGGRAEIVPMSWLAVVIGTLVAVAASTGLLWSGGAPFEHVTARGEVVQVYGQGLYRYDSLIAGAGHRGVDGVLLAVALPLLALGAFLHRRGSQRGTMILTATLAAILYVYVTLALGAAYNELLLVYTTVAAASALALAQAVAALDFGRLVRAHPERHARRTGAFLVAVGITTAVVWSVLIAEPHRAGAPAALGGATTYFTPAIDFAFVIPGVILAGILVRRRQPLGYAVAIPLLGILLFVGPAMIGQSVSHAAAGVRYSPQEVLTFILTFAVMSGGGALALWSLLHAGSAVQTADRPEQRLRTPRLRTP